MEAMSAEGRCVCVAAGAAAAPGETWAGAAAVEAGALAACPAAGVACRMPESDGSDAGDVAEGAPFVPVPVPDVAVGLAVGTVLVPDSVGEAALADGAAAELAAAAVDGAVEAVGGAGWS